MVVWFGNVVQMMGFDCFLDITPSLAHVHTQKQKTARTHNQTTKAHTLIHSHTHSHSLTHTLTHTLPQTSLMGMPSTLATPPTDAARMARAYDQQGQEIPLQDFGITNPVGVSFTQWV